MPARRGRLLLQGSAPNATLPNWFNLPSCSIHGSHNTSVLKGLPRIELGVFTFGPQNLSPQTFHPMSSKYMEPVIVLMLPGIFLWAVFMTSFCCFCYRRYRLGLCGEPFPTVRAYPPREVCTAMTVTAVTAAFVGLSSFAVCLVSYTSYHVAFAGVIRAGHALEAVVNASIADGASVLQSGLAMSASLDGFKSQVGAHADVDTLGADLECSLALLANLPNGAAMLHTASALGAASATFPPSSVTDALFADLLRPQERYPALLPPLQASLSSLRDRVAALPDLGLLVSRLDKLNSSVLNTTGVPTRLIRALEGANASLGMLPDLALLADRLSRVSHEQTSDSSYICSNIPAGWQPGDETECDRLKEQLRQAKSALESTDVESPLALLATYSTLSVDFPPLPAVTAALQLERAELGNFPNLTQVRLEYRILDALISSWSPVTIADSIGNVASAARALSHSNATHLVPELETLNDALTPLACIHDVLDALRVVNGSLLHLTPSVQTLFARASALSTALEAIPAPSAFIGALSSLASTLAALPKLTDYTAGVSRISYALGQMNASATLITALFDLEATLELPPSHAQLINSTAAMHAAMASLQAAAPFRASFESLNASRVALPPLLAQALAAVDRYDALGVTTGLVETLEATKVAVLSLRATLDAHPEEGTLRSGLASIDGELLRAPDVAPAVAQLQQLSMALYRLPPLNDYLSGLSGVMQATAAAPSVSSLSNAWTALNASLELVPSFALTSAPLSAYAAEQALLPSPPTKLLDGAMQLQEWLAAVPSLVAEGKGSLSATYAERLLSMTRLQRGLFGNDLNGYFAWLDRLRPSVESSWWAFLATTFAVPAGLTAVAMLSCVTRTGRPALHAGHALLGLLPWYMLLGASVEMPLALMLQDACDQVPFLVRTLTGFLSEEAIAVYKDPERAANYVEAGVALQGWVTGCPADAGGDPLATYFTPMVAAASSAQENATRALAALELRPAVRAHVDRLASEASALHLAAEATHQRLRCAKLHGIYSEMRTSVCCDFAYAISAMWMVRLAVAFAILASAVSAIAGYKRFRRQRDLWGPYATLQALEVGAYL